MRLFARVSNATTAYIQSLPEAERNQPARQKSLAGVRGGYVKSLSPARSSSPPTTSSPPPRGCTTRSRCATPRRISPRR